MFSQILFKLPQHLFLHQKVSGEAFLPPQVLFMPPQHFFIHQKVPGETFLSFQILSTLLHPLFNTKNISSHKTRPLTRAASSFFLYSTTSSSDASSYFCKIKFKSHIYFTTLSSVCPPFLKFINLIYYRFADYLIICTAL